MILKRTVMKPERHGKIYKQQKKNRKLKQCPNIGLPIPANVFNYDYTGKAISETVILEKKLKTWLDQPEVAPWFSPDTQIINETEILQQKGTFLRPDRVVISGEEVSVIDYKFGNIQKKSYHKQVIRYISLIKEMGFSQVKGYIWYVELGKIVSV